MKRVVTWAVVAALIFVGASLASRWNPIKDVLDSIFPPTQTSEATGDVVLKRLQAQRKLVAATGTFEVPVVVCNGRPKAYDLADRADKDGRTPAERLLSACDGILDSKATVLAKAEVDAVIDLGKLTADDIEISGKRVSVRLPRVELTEPRIDAERGMAVIGKTGSIPIIGGKLPDDYQSRAATAAKKAVSGLAGQSGLPRTGSRSARSLFEGLLAGLGFTQTDVTIANEN